MGLWAALSAELRISADCMGLQWRKLPALTGVMKIAILLFLVGEGHTKGMR